MKTINKYFMMLVSALALTCASCDDGNVGTIYTPSADEKGYTFLSEESNASYTPADTDSIFVIRIARNFTQGSEIVPLIVDGADPLFVIPDSVVFADGEGHADLEIGIKGMATGSTYTFTVAIDTTVVPLASMIADSAKYTKEGIAMTEVSLTLDYTWMPLGTGKYTSQLFGDAWEQDVEYAKEIPNMYRLPDCIYEGYPFVFTLSEDGKELLTWDPQPTGYDQTSYGMLYFAAAGMVREGNVLQFPMYGLVVYNGGWGTLYSGFTETLELPKK